MVDEHVAERTVLDEQVAELQRLGFAIESRSDSEVVATRRKWYWDCLVTNLTVVVFLKATTGVLSWSQITDETDELLARARELDAGAPALQHGVAAFPVYVADRVDPEVQYYFDSRRPSHWGAMSFPAALDRSTGQAYFRRKTPFWGGVYFAKFRFLAARLLEPASAPAREPPSVFGLVLTMIIPAVFVIAILAAFLTG
jgi:hypothetical protein